MLSLFFFLKKKWKVFEKYVNVREKSFDLTFLFFVNNFCYVLRQHKRKQSWSGYKHRELIFNYNETLKMQDSSMAQLPRPRLVWLAFGSYVSPTKSGSNFRGWPVADEILSSCLIALISNQSSSGGKCPLTQNLEIIVNCHRLHIRWYFRYSSSFESKLRHNSSVICGKVVSIVSPF